jgi:CheY-like chemotaxis protein
MNGIIGMTSLLLDTSLDPAQRDFAETIRASANSLLTVINDILDFSKIEAGKLDIESIEMSLSDNINEVLAMLSFQSAAKNLRLGVDVEADVPRRVLGDPQRIRQCLINLISNAIKFTPAGEVVCAVSVAGRHDGRVLVRFEVRDTGIGIEPETLRTLFQPFVQADSSTTRHFGGTGLGLSIVRRLVEMMGGEVGVESVPGRGSRFWFLLPLPVVDAAQIGATSITVPAPVLRDDTGSHPGPAASGFGKNYAGRVLLVEDNPVNQKVARIFLERLGCEVTLAGHGMDAVTAFTADKFDLVLLDLQMPIMDGYTATGRLRELEPPGTRTPIVALTASAMSGQRERCLAAGMDELLTKPLDVERLREVLDRFNLRVLAAPAVLDDRAIADLVASGPPQEPLDLARLQALVGRDNDFAADLAETFRTTSRALLNELRACAERNDREGARRAAHSLKGASANIHAPRLRELATQLEIQASTLADAELAGFLTGITTETERVISALERFAPRGGQAVAAR